jgi:hypothetical protein
MGSVAFFAEEIATSPLRIHGPEMSNLSMELPRKSFQFILKKSHDSDYWLFKS